MTDALVLTAPPQVSQVVAFTTATKSAQLGRTVRFVTLSATAAVYVAFGDTNVVATATNGMYIPPNTLVAVLVPANSFLSALQAVAGGNLFITEWA